MSYTKSYTAWADFPSTATPATAAKLQNIDDGLANADTRITAITSQVDNITNVGGYPLTINAAFDVMAYGAVGNGVTDDTTAIQSAINAAHSAGGGVVRFPSNVYVVNGTLDLTDMESIALVGDSSTNSIYFPVPTTGTVLKRVSGTGTMLKWEASAAGQSLRGNRIEGIAFLGGSLAATGLSLKSHYGGTFRDVYVRDCTSTGISINTVNLAGVEDFQRCLFENVSVTQEGTSANAWVLDSFAGRAAVSEGNISLNTFLNCACYVVNGTGWTIGDSDDNVFISCTTNTGGTGIGFDLLGSNAGSGHCRHNAFLFCLNDGGSTIISRGTDAGYTTAAASNYMLQTRADSSSVPTVGTGSSLWLDDTTGISKRVAFTSSTVATSSVTLPNNSSIYWRNVTNTADDQVFAYNTSNEIQAFPTMRIARLIIGNAQNITVGTATGTQIGTATNEKLGFWGKTPVIRPSAYTPTNVTTDRAYDANATTIDELADVLGTLIADLQSIGLVG